MATKNVGKPVKRQAKEKSEPTSVEHNYLDPPDSIPLPSVNVESGGNGGNDDYHNGNGNGHGNGNGNGNGRRKNGGKGRGGSVDFDDPVIFVDPRETTEFVGISITEPVTTSTTTMATTTTTQPPRNCVVQRPRQSDQLIREGSSKRIYSLDDVECSELCSCGESLILTCHALCVPFAPCRTALAFYSHASPAYQAFRGRCLCYSGRFICMKPPLGEYILPGGIFLLLGYSAADEALLRPHTNLGVQDAVRALQQYITTYIDNQTQCTLTLFNMTEENIIIAARLPHDGKLKDIELLRKEKDECTAILKTISHQINSEHSELQSHRLLSIFKMSEVEVVWPESTSAAARSGHGPGQFAGCHRLLYAAMLALAYLSSWTTLRMSDVAT
ncbi:GM23197 [Drosophila sechellia]|uniref:GM23197 n=1 Tax=Drosophila sechellia TaxID=7238 RepID=B4IID1_DROSE|nr:GM23197 [Drosophila sechellia]